MKQKFSLIIILVFGLFASCTSKFEQYNTDTKNATEVPGSYVFSDGEYLLSYYVANNNVNINIFNMMAQYWTETTYTDEANWNLVNRTISDNFSRRLYYALNQFNVSAKTIREEVTYTDEEKAIKNNKLYIISLLKAYTFQTLVDLFGDVPYTESLNPENTHPVYDGAATIYAALIDSVKAAYTGLDENYASFGDADFFYKGDVASWKKFAASLLIKLAINSYDANAATSKTIIESYYDKCFTSLSDGAYFPFSSAPYDNPVHQDLVSSGRKDFVICATLLDQMDTLDPRLPFYTTTNVGGPYGENDNYNSYGHPTSNITDQAFPGLILTYDEIAFYLAEATERGCILGETAAQYYADAITANIEWWTGSTSGASTYLTAHPYVDINTIAKESWIAEYMRGFISWTTYRRIDGAFTLNMPPNPPEGVNVIPTRFTYPINEQTLNGVNYTAAATAMGGDLMTKKIFWDVH